jgi:hypothetical protein
MLRSRRPSIQSTRRGTATLIAARSATRWSPRCGSTRRTPVHTLPRESATDPAYVRARASIAAGPPSRPGGRSIHETPHPDVGRGVSRVVRMSGVAAAGESRVEATLERVLSDPLCTVRAVSVSVSAVSVSAAVTAVTGAGLAVAASVLGVRVRAEAVSGAEAVLTVVSEAVHGPRARGRGRSLGRTGVRSRGGKPRPWRGPPKPCRRARGRGVSSSQPNARAIFSSEASVVAMSSGGHGLGDRGADLVDEGAEAFLRRAAVVGERPAFSLGGDPAALDESMQLVAVQRAVGCDGARRRC